MNMLKTILLGLLLLCPRYNAFSQTVVNDSCVVLTPTEVKILTKMTEDLRYTKQELQICDSIIVKKDTIISAQKSIITEKDKIITTEKKKAKKIGLISGGLGIVVGLIFGVVL
jgi:hypothetical protein